MGKRIPQVDGAFRARVYEIVRLIPYGRVTTYGLVSTLAGMPRHARQVGWALHTLPAELVWGVETDRRRGHATDRNGAVLPEIERDLGRVPWHRVVNAKGRVSTHPDEAGTYRQIHLLRAEGLPLSDDGVLIHGLAAHEWIPEPETVDQLELPSHVLFALDQHFD